VRVHPVLEALRLGILQTVVVRDGFKHVKPHCALLAPKVSRFNLDAVERSHRPTGSCQLGAESKTNAHAARLARRKTFALLDVVLFVVFDLTQKLVETLFCLFGLHLVEGLSIVLGHSHFHLPQLTLLFDVAGEDLFLRVHVVVAIKIDRFGSCGRIPQVLLHLLNLELFSFLLGELITRLELLIRPDNLRVEAQTAPGTRFVQQSALLFLLLRGLFLTADHAFVDDVGDQDRAEGRDPEQSGLSLVNVERSFHLLLQTLLRLVIET